MPAYLLTWNPNSWEWTHLRRDVAKVARGEAHELTWSCGNTKSIPIGSRVFLLRQGVEPRGIMASGWVTNPTFQHEHWDAERARAGDRANFVRFSVDTIVDPDIDRPMAVRNLDSAVMRAVNWSTPASGISLREEAALELEGHWAAYMPRGRRDLGAAVTSATEGRMTMRLVRHRSRERALRAAKIRGAIEAAVDGRLRCEVPNCGFDFEATYGLVGKGYAEVHHIRPLGEVDGMVRTTLEDLVVVCSNCHAMIHRGGGARPPLQLIRARRS